MVLLQILNVLNGFVKHCGVVVLLLFGLASCAPYYMYEFESHETSSALCLNIPPIRGRCEHYMFN